MSDHEHHFSLDDLPRGGERFDLTKVSKLNGALLGIGAIGLVISLCYMLGLFGAERQAEFAYSWLFAFWFFFTITCGGIFWTMLQHLSNAGWSVTVRRVFENLGSNALWMAICAIPFYLRYPFKMQDALWEWMGLERKAVSLGNGNLHEGFEKLIEEDPHAPILEAKHGWLNITAFTIRGVLLFGFLYLLIKTLRKWSIKQDHDGDFRHTFRSRALCAFPMLIYALAVTFLSIDLVMSLDYTWFSTMWGVQIFAGGAWSGMAVSILILIFIRSQGYLQKTTSMEHFHLMGKLLLAFTIFWAYVTFSQFFLIWYANITEETRFFLIRNTGPWWWLSHALVWGHFVVTFVLLLSAARKKKPQSMIWVCVWVLLMHFVDWYWLVIPERAPSLTHGHELLSPGAWWGDLFAFIGIGGISAWAFLRRTAGASLYPCRDPRLLESVLATNSPA
jgi:hypothetical protein